MQTREDTVRNCSKILLVSVAFLAVAACAAKQATREPQLDSVGFEPKAIQVHFKVDPQLNLYDESPHTLHVCVYQLEDPNSFNQHAQDKEGLYKLLECDRFDASVTNAKRQVCQPGRDKSFTLDRAEGTRYVGVVGGYYSLETKNVVRLFQIPVIVKKKGLIKRKKIIRPGTLNIDLYLGPQSLQKFERK